MQAQQTSPPLLFAQPTGAGEPSMTLRDVLAMLWRQAGLIVLCTVLVGGAVAWLLVGQPTLHSSTATVWIQTEQQGMPTFLSGIAAYRDSPYPDPVNRKIETEMELMITRTAATEVIRSLGIREEQLARSPLDHVKARVASLFPKKERAGGAAGDGATGLEEQFLKGFSVAPLRSGSADTTSNVLELKFESADAELAPRALQAVLNSYFRLAAQQNRTLGQFTARLIDGQLVQAREELRAVEDNILSLAVRGAVRDELVLDGPAPGSRSRAGAAGAGVSGAAGAMDDASAGGASALRNTVVVSPGGLRYDLGSDVSGAAQTQAMTVLKTQALELQAQLEQARQLYTEDAENVKVLRQRLASVQQRLQQGIARGARVEAEMTRLERQRGIAQERFVELRKKLDQIELYLQLNPTDAASRSVIDPPSHPDPEQGRKRGVLLLLGPIVGLLLGLLLAGLREFMDSRLRSPAEVQRALGLPVLGALPRLRRGEREQLARALG